MHSIAFQIISQFFNQSELLSFYCKSYTHPHSLRASNAPTVHSLQINRDAFQFFIGAHAAFYQTKLCANVSPLFISMQRPGALFSEPEPTPSRGKIHPRVGGLNLPLESKLTLHAPFPSLSVCIFFGPGRWWKRCKFTNFSTPSR